MCSLLSRMVHGRLVQPHTDFFIQPLEDWAPPGAQPAGAALSGPITAATSPLPQSNQGSETAFDDWFGSYGVKLEALPLSHISLEAADAALFVGKAVRILRQPQGAFKGAELLPYK